MNSWNVLVVLVLVAVAVNADGIFDIEKVRKLGEEKISDPEWKKAFLANVDQLKPCFDTLGSMTEDAQKIAKDMYFQAINYCKQQIQGLAQGPEKTQKLRDCFKQKSEEFKKQDKVTGDDGTKFASAATCIQETFKKIREKQQQS